MEYHLKDYCFLCIIILEVITLADSILRDKALQNDCGAIRRMLISSLKTIKSKLGFGLSPKKHLYIQMRC